MPARRDSIEHEDRLARVIWDYHHVGHTPAPADVIIALGSHDTRVADRAAALFLDGFAPWLLCSGDVGALTLGLWHRPEAEVFRDVALARGVPPDRILLEPRSTNSGENMAFSDALLRERGIPASSLLLVHKPYMERRAYATARKYWPDKVLIVTSPPIAFDDYPTEGITREDVIHIMVGDLQRVREYGRSGFQIPQTIPDEVWAAAEELMAMGYTKHLIRGAR